MLYLLKCTDKRYSIYKNEKKPLKNTSNLPLIIVTVIPILAVIIAFILSVAVRYVEEKRLQDLYDQAVQRVFTINQQLSDRYLPKAERRLLEIESTEICQELSKGYTYRSYM